MKVIKRNGVEVDFTPSKIKAAIEAANNDVVENERMDDRAIEELTHTITNRCESLNRAVSVEEIQDIVEKYIMISGSYDVARAYIRYRYDHEKIRNRNTTDDAIMSLIECNNEEVKQENSNKNPTILSTQRDYMAGEVSKDLARRVFIPDDIVKAHDEGVIHFHDMDYFAQHEHNCFSSTTRFVTNTGIKSFADCNDGQVVTVLTKDGTWKKATVHNYGKRKMQYVTLKSCRTEKVIKCTSNHRWILKNGEVTTNLKVGDRLCLLPEIDNFEDIPDIDAFCFGFILGDGTEHKTNNPDKYRLTVRLCGEKIKYLDCFVKAGYIISSQKDTENPSDIFLGKSGPLSKKEFLTQRAWKWLSHDSMKSLFMGYYAADGATDSNRISTSDDNLAQMIRDISAVSGYHIAGEKKIVHDTNFKENAVLYNFTFIKSLNPKRNWIVTSIENDNHGCVYDAWCVEEPETKSFTLEGGIITGNCCLLNLEDMLQNGTVISGTMIEKPHSFSTACNIATQIIAQVASSQYGGQSISLAHLAPFVQASREKFAEKYSYLMSSLGVIEYDEFIENLVMEDIAKGVQTIQYQVVTLMTTNGQAPFITVYMNINEVPEGQTKDDLAVIIAEVLRQRIQGVKNEKGVWITPAFPKLIYVLDDNNVKPDSEYYYLTKLAAECTAKRMVPDYISAKIMRQLKDGNVYTCMGCRSFLTPYYEYQVEEDEFSKYTTLKPKFYGRFNQGVVTINLVDVALSSGKQFDKFWDILNERLELCYRALMIRHNRLEGTVSDVAPIIWQHGGLARLEKGETIDRLLHGGYSTISLGYAGLYECTKYMTGVSHTDSTGKPFAIEVMEFMNTKCKQWKEMENVDFSLYGTPLESTTYKFAKCLQKRFGVIPGVTDKNYITNSYHVHVTEKIDAFSKLKFESEFQALSPGGAISYVEVPNMTNNIEAVLAVMDYIYENIMYAELNTKSDYCQVCGYEGEIQIVEEDGKLIWECPNCGNRDENKLNVARRTCGYLGTNFWNQGRTQEIKERVLHL